MIGRKVVLQVVLAALLVEVAAAVPLKYKKSITKSIVDANQGLHLFQGDLVFTKEQKEKPKKGVLSAVLKDRNVKWPNNVVPYVISNKFSKEEKENFIRKGMKDIEAVTCISFKEYQEPPKHTTYIRIIDGDGCWSYVGRAHTDPGKVQELSLNREGCLYVGTVIHELLHALGMFHEQSRPDRDKYVKLFPENMVEGAEENFEIRDDTYDHNSSYDPDSIMHYERTAYSKNNKPTILWKKDPSRELGGEVLTKDDIHQINAFYSCLNPHKTNSTPTPEVTLTLTSPTTYEITTDATSYPTMITSTTSHGDTTSSSEITCDGDHDHRHTVSTTVTTEDTTFPATVSTTMHVETTTETEISWPTTDAHIEIWEEIEW